MSQENPNIDHQTATDDGSKEQLFLSKVDAWLAGGGDINSPFSAKGETALHFAAQNGYVRAINIFIAKGANINIQHPASKYTALHMAAVHGHAEAIHALINIGHANVEILDNIGDTALHIAASKGYTDVIKILINLGHANVEILDCSGNTALHIATSKGYTDVIKILINIGHVNVNVYNPSQQTALHSAVIYEHTDIIEALIDAKINVNAQGIGELTALHLAISGGYVKAINALINAGAKVDIQDMTGSTALHLAAEYGHVETIQALINVGAKIEACNNKRNTPLHFAAKAGQAKAIEVLIAAGAKVDPWDTDGLTALHLAAENGHAEAINALIAAGAKVDACCTMGVYTALHLAAEQGKTDAINALIAAGAKVDACNKNGSTALHVAAQKGHAEAIKALINVGHAKVEIQRADGCTALHLAAEMGHGEAIKALINVGHANVDALDILEGYTALHMAAQNGHIKAIDALITLGHANIEIPDPKGYTALHMAVQYFQVGAIDALINLGRANIDARGTQGGSTALHLAIEKGSIGTVKLLISAGANIEIPDANGNTALHAAAHMASVSTIEELITARQVNVNACNKEGRSALHFAAQKGHPGALKALIAAGVNIEIQDADSRTALHIAAEKGHAEAIDVLITLGHANVETQDTLRCTALHIAALNGHAKAIKTLINVGHANVDAPDILEGYTALHIAAQNGHAEAIKALINVGHANVDTQDANGHTALHIASENGHTEAIHALITLGHANVEIPDPKGNTALHFAAVQGKTGAIKALIVGRANIEACDPNGRTALHLASENGHTEAIKELINVGHVNVEIPDAQGSTALHIAAKSGQPEAIHALINVGHAKVEACDPMGRTALHIAAKSGQPEAIHALIIGHAKVEACDPMGLTALHIAAKSGQLDAIKTLINIGHAKVEACDPIGRTALHIAALNGQLDAIKTLIIVGHANIEAQDTNGLTALHIAALNGQLDAIKTLITVGAKVEALDSEGLTALHIAAKSGQPEAINTLITAGRAKIEACDPKGFTALHIAAKSGQPEAINTLIKEGANVEARNINGFTALHCSASRKDLASLVQLIIVGKANVNVANKSGFTALHMAAKSGNAEAIQELIKARAEVNAVSSGNHTALYVAAEHGNIEAVKVLIDARADVNAASASNHTALHIAARNGYINIMQLLLQHNANITALVNGFTPMHYAAARGHIDFAIKEWATRGDNITENLYKTLHRAAEIGRKDSITLLLQKLDPQAKSTFLLSVKPSFLLQMSAHDFLESISEILKHKEIIDFSADSQQLVSFIEAQTKAIIAPTKTTSHAGRGANCTKNLKQILHILVNSNIKLPGDVVTITPNILGGGNFEEDIEILQILAKYDAHFRCELNNMALATWSQYHNDKDKIKESRLFDTFKLFQCNKVDWEELFTKIVNGNDDVLQDSKYYLPLFKARLGNAQFINMCKKYIISALDIEPVLETISNYSSIEEMQDEEGNTLWHWFAENIHCNLTNFDHLNIDLNATNNAGETVFARIIKCQNAIKITNIIRGNWDLIVRQNVDVNQHTTDGECALTKLAKDLKTVGEIREFIIKCKPSGEFFFNINQIDTSETPATPQRVMDYIAQYYKERKGGDMDFINDLRKCGSLEPQYQPFISQKIEGFKMEGRDIHAHNNDENAYNTVNILYERYPLSPQEINKVIDDFQQKHNSTFETRVSKCAEALINWYFRPAQDQDTIIRILVQSGIAIPNTLTTSSNCANTKEELVHSIRARCRENDDRTDTVELFLREICTIARALLFTTGHNIFGNPLVMYNQILHGTIAWDEDDPEITSVCKVVDALSGKHKGHAYKMGPGTNVPLAASANSPAHMVIVDFKKLIGTMIHMVNQNPDLMINTLYISRGQIRLEDMFIYCLRELNMCVTGKLINLMLVAQPVLLKEEVNYQDDEFTPQFIQLTSKLLESIAQKFPDMPNKALLAWIYDMTSSLIQPQEWGGFTQTIHGILNQIIITHGLAPNNKSYPFKGILGRILDFTGEIIQGSDCSYVIRNETDEAWINVMRSGIRCIATEWCENAVRALIDGKPIEVPKNIYCASLAFGEFTTVSIEVFRDAIEKLPANKVAEFLVILINHFSLGDDVGKELSENLIAHVESYPEELAALLAVNYSIMRTINEFKVSDQSMKALYEFIHGHLPNIVNKYSWMKKYVPVIVPEASGEESADAIAEIENAQDDVDATGVDYTTDTAI